MGGNHLAYTRPASPSTQHGQERNKRLSKRDNELYYIVAGWPRCGTSMMMAVLEEGGIPAKYDRELVQKLKEHNEQEGGYQPYPVGGREMPRGIKSVNPHTGEFVVGELLMARQTIQKELRGTCVKIVNNYVKEYPTLKPAKVIYMLRPWEEARASALKTFMHRDPNKMVSENKSRFDGGNDWYISYWNMKADTEVMIVNYHSILLDPLDQCERIRAFGIPIDVALSAATINPKWYRHRIGDNC